tara:strand:- start:28 stop:336 length:309 start_codon:yes stop_codon:yes gene_type:complete
MQVKTFTKRDIAKIVSKNLDTSVRKSVIYTDKVFSAVRELLCKDNEYIRVEIRNFGVIESKPTKAKPKARNPRTNEEIFVPAHKKTHFKPGKFLKNHLKKPL